MRDLGGAGAKTVKDCRERGIPDLLCHYHFLAAGGERLLAGGDALLRGRLRELLRATRPRACARICRRSWCGS